MAHQALPFVVHALQRDTPLAAWLQASWPGLTARLDADGALLFRGFKVEQIDDFRAAAVSATPELLDYEEPSTPRSALGGNVFTSTEYPPDQRIPQHNEMSYRRTWPQYLWMWLQTPAETGGRTPLTDYRKVLLRLSERTRDAFESMGVMYERRYNTGFDITWQSAFRTGSRDAVEAQLSAAGVEFRWIGPQVLLTRQVVQGVLAHPRTGTKSWFNQANLFHPSSLPDDVREGLVAALGADLLPRMAKYGDGSPITLDTLREINNAIDAETVYPEWQPGDVAVVDNLSVAHGREPFSGPRRVFVAMAAPMQSKFTAPGPQDSA